MDLPPPHDVDEWLWRRKRELERPVWHLTWGQLAWAVAAWATIVGVVIALWRLW